MGRVSNLLRRAINRAVGAGQRISDFAEAVRPALGAGRTDTPIVVQPREAPTRPASPPPKPPVATPSPPPQPSPKKLERQRRAQRSGDDVRWELARHVSQTVTERSGILLDAAPWTEDGHDAETIRQIRVASRRLRAFVELFEPKLPPKLARRLRKRLRKVTRTLGPLRDWDVYNDALQTRLMGADGGQAAAIEHVLVDIGRQRDEAREAARAALDALDRDRLRRDLDRAVGTAIGPYVQMRVEAKTDAWTLLRPKVEALLAKVAEVDDLDDEEKVHDIRITAKRLRYAYDLLGPVFDDPRRAREPLKRVQRVIGDARERTLLVDFLEGHRGTLHGQGRPHLASGLMPLLATLATEAQEAQTRIPETMARLDERLPARTQAALGAQPVAVVPDKPEERAS